MLLQIKYRYEIEVVLQIWKIVWKNIMESFCKDKLRRMEGR